MLRGIHSSPSPQGDLRFFLANGYFPLTANWTRILRIKRISIHENPRYGNIVHGARQEEVKQVIEGLQTMRILANNMAYFLKCKELATNAGLPMPEQEAVTFTNFIRE